MIYLLPILLLFVFFAFITIWQDMRIDELESDTRIGLRETELDVEWLENRLRELDGRLDNYHDYLGEHKEAIQVLAEQHDGKIEKVDELQLIEKDES